MGQPDLAPSTPRHDEYFDEYFHGIGSATNVAPLSDVAAEVRKAFPQAAIEIGPGGDPMYDWQEEFDIGAARRDLGFSPRVGFQDGIGAFIEALQSRHAEEKR